MWVRRVHIEGLGIASPIERTELQRAHLEPRGPGGPGLADGLRLVAAFLQPDRAPRILKSLDLATADTAYSLDGSLLDEVERLDPHGVDALVDARFPRHITVEIELELDPPTYGTVRELASR